MARIITINELNNVDVTSSKNLNVMVQGQNGDTLLKMNLGNAAVGIVAPYYNTTSSGYNIGDYFIYSGSLYKATSVIGIGEVFDEDKAIETTLAYERPVYTSVVLPAANWVDGEQITTISGVTENNNIFVSFAPASLEVGAKHRIYCATQGNGFLVFKCASVPEVDVAVNLKIES